MIFMYNNEPRISIIVPVFNTGKYLDRCLNSLLNQDFEQEYEIIAINDGSADNSLEILEAAAKRYKNIRVYSQENSGVSAARNNGIARARGKYVMFADSDDFVERNYLSEMYRAAENSGADIVCCNFRCVNEEGKLSGADGMLRHRAGVFDSRDMLRSLLLDVTIRSFMWNKLFRRSLFTENDIKFPVGKIYEDIRTIPKLFCCSEKVAVIKGVLYNYVQHKGSITGNMTPEKVFKYIGAYGSVRKLLDEKQIYSDYALAYKFQGVKIAFTVIPMLIADKFKDPDTELFKCCAIAIYRLNRFSK